MAPLELIARTFATEHCMPIRESNGGFSGQQGLLSLTYFGRNPHLLIKKTFPARSEMKESTVFVSDRKQSLKMRVLYGCLQDYIAVLDHSNNIFCHYVQDALLHYLGEDIEPEKLISEEVAMTDYVSVALLLDYIYPANYID